MSGFYIATPERNTAGNFIFNIAMKQKPEKWYLPFLGKYVVANPYCQRTFYTRLIMKFVRYSSTSLLRTTRLSICSDEQINHPQCKGKQFSKIRPKMIFILLLLMWAPPVLPRNQLPAIHKLTIHKWLPREAEESPKTFRIPNRIRPSPKLTMLVIGI